MFVIFMYVHFSFYMDVCMSGQVYASLREAVIIKRGRIESMQNFFSINNICFDFI